MLLLLLGLLHGSPTQRTPLWLWGDQGPGFRVRDSLRQTLLPAVCSDLQAYTAKKRLESYMRRLVSSAHSISAVSPTFYAGRFRAAMKKVFV